MSEREWRVIPQGRGMSACYLLAGVLLAINASVQLKDGVAALPLLSGIAAVAMVVVAVMGLMRPTSRAHH
ncbi:hypothetical protein ABZ439_37220 [Streptomyces sp. NPDC005840]|uniref:hypothetical protein n=1 Tax=Streptomyces sp. NPDC005840 TaxID=3157072 RepID=UPI0033E8E2A0